MEFYGEFEDTFGSPFAAALQFLRSASLICRRFCPGEEAEVLYQLKKVFEHTHSNLNGTLSLAG